MISKVVNFIGCQFRFLTSTYRQWVIRWTLAGCEFGKGVSIGHHVTIKATDGGEIKIGNRVSIKPGVVIIVKSGLLSVGDDSFIGWGTLICANEKIEIGNDALIAEYVTIRDQNHSVKTECEPFRCQPMESKPIRIGSNVWLGAKSTVLPGVTIGDSSVIGAHSLVNKDVDEKTVVAGVPAKELRKL